ncbi:MAG: SDR family oxidoreductase [Anaerolineae bacterium]|nr:SDR family oxidoreductase [Anaerolineae bacterium]
MRRILITGTSRGIGLELARQYAARDERVFATYRTPSAALKALESVRVTLIPLDVADPASIEAAYHAVNAQTDSLDVLINNAAISNEGDERLGTFEQASMLSLFQTNTIAPVLIMQRFLELLKRGATGKIVNLVSELASLELRDASYAATYCATKAALNMYTRSLAHDLKPLGLTAFTIDPGWVQTDMGGRHAPLTPEQSVSGILRVIDQANRDANGRFFRHDGAEMPW